MYISIMSKFPIFRIKNYTNIFPIQLLRKISQYINNPEAYILRSEI